MCSELTPRAHVPDNRIPQLMQPWLGISNLEIFYGKFFWQYWQKLFLCKGRRHNLFSLVATPAATAQISDTLSVANTLIQCTPSGQYTDTLYYQWPIHWYWTVNSVVLWQVYWYRIHPNTLSGRISYPPQVNIPIPVSWETFQRSIRKGLENPGI